MPTVDKITDRFLKSDKYVPPAKGRRHVLRVVREILYFRPRGKRTNLGAALDHLSRAQKRRAVVFVLSDFLASGYERSLRVASRRHDVVAVRVRDPRETSLPTVGLVRWMDAETGQECLVDTSAEVSSRLVAHRAGNMDANLERLFASRGVDLMDVDVTESYVEPLRKFFLAREGRRGRRRSS